MAKEEEPQTADVFNSNEKAIELLISELEKEEEALRRATKTGKERVKIQKVPNNIKLGRQHYYTPSVISIGPIHADKEELAKRDLKLRLAARFVKDSGGTNKELLGFIRDEFGEIKKCYEESVVEPFDDNQLLSLVFLDACFVLQFIHGMYKNKLNEFGINSGLQNSIQRDLFLVENQLPFRLIETLILYRDIPHEMWRSIVCFMGINAFSPMTSREIDGHCTKFHTLYSEDTVHLLGLFRNFFLPLHKRRSKIHDSPRSFRNVQDLKLAGIEIKPRPIDDDDDDDDDVSFSKCWFFNATLRLPELVVDGSTASKLLNLVAYEMCPGMCDFGVSSYLFLMDSLVDTEQDVRDLRAAHVLHNRLGSDEEVAKLFNEIGSNLVTDDRYFDVHEKIQKHYESKLALWWAQFHQDYFSNPWKVLALVAGTLVLLFGGVSAYYAMFPRQGGGGD